VQVATLDILVQNKPWDRTATIDAVGVSVKIDKLAGANAGISRPKSPTLKGRDSVISQVSSQYQVMT
jgi:hypothetical protein